MITFPTGDLEEGEKDKKLTLAQKIFVSCSIQGTF
jgi:hypothetical protein